MVSHAHNIQLKQGSRTSAIDRLAAYNEPITKKDRDLLNTSVRDLVTQVNEQKVNPRTILLAFGKQAFEAQTKCNTLTEVMIQDAESWATKTEGPLAGIPVSLKDTFEVAGYDSTLGYSKFCGQPVNEDAPIVKLIKDAGGYPYVKTNIPLTLLSFESYNDIWGTTDNPHVSGFTPGGSTGGEAALIAMGGSRIGIGTDVAGSVRVPAHFSGIYALRPTTTRFPKSGCRSSMPGQEGVPAVAGPMARTLGDLSYFFKAVIDMKPWNYDYAVTERPWSEPKLPKKVKFGVIYSDGVVDPSPACLRALETSVKALQAQGHVCEKFTVPDPVEVLSVGAQLLCADGIETASTGLFWGEHNDVGVARARLWARLPKFVRSIWAFIVEHWYKDKVWATLLRNFESISARRNWELVTRREAYRKRFSQAVKESGVHFLLTVPNATPALPHRGLYNSFSSCLYTFLFNVVDYPAGVLPVTKVDAAKDALPQSFSLKQLNGVARGAYINYDAQKMHGLPVGVQVIGKRFHEEDVLRGMEIVENALHSYGTVYKQLEV